MLEAYCREKLGPLALHPTGGALHESGHAFRQDVASVRRHGDPVAGKLRALFFLWSLAVFVVLFRGFFLTSYSFAGPVHFKAAVCLTVFALIATIGAWPWTRRREPIRRPMKY